MKLNAGYIALFIVGAVVGLMLAMKVASYLLGFEQHIF